MKTLKRIFIIGCALLLSLSLVACSDVDSYNTDRSAGEIAGDDDLGQKIIHEVVIDVSADDVGAVKSTLLNKLKELGGYIADSDESYDDDGCRYAKIVYKVNSEKLYEFLDVIETNGTVTNKRIETYDASHSYNGALARLETLKQEKAILENALSNENLTADDIIKLNNEISEINDQINRLTITINNYEQQTAYSTVTLLISRKESAASSIIPVIVLAVLSPIIFCSIYFPVSRTKRRTAERVRREKEEQLRMQELLNSRNQSNNR